jgi:hypothetical protein
MRKVGRMTEGGFDQWFGLAPDDSPLVTRDISTRRSTPSKWTGRKMAG